ncbi:hypothetical protein R1flu_020538 [Riccia fluitans]|uniref:Uncharacterized protein n=1 Tax=Riccia fluitans TaxID=41844 RepID=A0ABD1ZLT0_9MARC
MDDGVITVTGVHGNGDVRSSRQKGWMWIGQDDKASKALEPKRLWKKTRKEKAFLASVRHRRPYLRFVTDRIRTSPLPYEVRPGPSSATDARPLTFDFQRCKQRAVIVTGLPFQAYRATQALAPLSNIQHLKYSVRPSPAANITFILAVYEEDSGSKCLSSGRT